MHVLTRAELLFTLCYEIPCTLEWSKGYVDLSPRLRFQDVDTKQDMNLYLGHFISEECFMTRYP